MEFQLFQSWRPTVHTVADLTELELCPASFQADALADFCLAWAQPSAVHAWMLDPGERLYDFTPKATRSKWNERFFHWCRSAWLAQVHQFQTRKEVRGLDRVWLSDYANLLQRCLANPKWLAKVSDFHFRNPQCSRPANIPDADTRAESASRA